MIISKEDEKLYAEIDSLSEKQAKVTLRWIVEKIDTVAMKIDMRTALKVAKSYPQN